jgi:membrane protein YqaA with SNARE-associated domain
MADLTTTTHVLTTVAGAVAGTVLIGTAGVLLAPAAGILGLGAVLTAIAIPSVGTALGGWAGWALGKPSPTVVQGLISQPMIRR